VIRTTNTKEKMRKTTQMEREVNTKITKKESSEPIEAQHCCRI
jgi:hypothetical protein